MNYYPFHLGDYASHTAHLEPLEDLAYRRMLDAYYLREGPLPADVADVARLIRMRSHQAEVEAVLDEFFEPTEDGWRHFRCDEEIARMQDKQAKAKASAAASVNARRAKAERPSNERTANAERTFNDRSTDVELPTPTPTPIPTPKKRESAQKRAARRCPESFDLDDQMREWAVENAPAVDVDLATAKFKDHTFRTAITDWPAAWRNWLRKEQEFADQRRPLSVQRLSTAETFRERDERLAREKWERATGRASSSPSNVIDVTPSGDNLLEFFK